MAKNDETAFKHWISPELLSRISLAILKSYPEFDRIQFEGLAEKLIPLELKARVQLVRNQLRAQLPEAFPVALKILLNSTKHGSLKSFDLWPYTEFVQTYGLRHLEISLDALAEFTKLFTSEFAVRPFLKTEEKRTIEYLMQCAHSKNEHLRRWASEGSRPRLPWGERLDGFITHPEKTVPILEVLKNDPALYVRKSVANHLNDITKDHPGLVIKLLKQWIKDALPPQKRNIEWIIHRALRTEIKNGNPSALALIGVKSTAAFALRRFSINGKQFSIDDKIEMDIEIKSEALRPQKLVVDYIVHFARASGKTSAKVFKLKTVTLKGEEVLRIKKHHSLKEVTTRKHYPGAHAIELQINGQKLKRVSWRLS